MNNDALDSDLLAEKTEFKFKARPLLIWIGIFMFFGCFFKIMHWPGGNISLIIGASGFIAYNLSEAIRLKWKNNFNNICCLVSLAWPAYLLYGFLTRGYYYGVEGTLIHLISFSIIFLIYRIIAFTKNRKQRQMNT